jgi:hypothetical protein
MRAGPIFAVLFSATFLAAQNASMAAPMHAVKSAHVKERLLAANQERMCWEATQTWLAPAIPQQPDPAEHHAIHIDAVNQPPLKAPKLRREWLIPSDEAKLVGGK